MIEGDAKSENRRTWRRRVGKGSLRVACRKGTLGLGANIAVRLLNLSEAGVCLVVKIELGKGDEVEVTLNPQGGKEATRKGQVVWSTLSGEECLIGVRFDKMLGYSALGDLCRS